MEMMVCLPHLLAKKATGSYLTRVLGSLAVDKQNLYQILLLYVPV
jgi:hypothetical protein